MPSLVLIPVDPQTRVTDFLIAAGEQRSFGARREGRTPTLSPEPDFESVGLTLSYPTYQSISRRIGNLHASRCDLKNRFYLMPTDDYGTNYGTVQAYFFSLLFMTGISSPIASSALSASWANALGEVSSGICVRFQPFLGV